MNFYPLLKPFLFSLDPEQAHHVTIHGLKTFGKIPSLLNLASGGSIQHYSLQRNLFGLNFPNPIGLAAGLDKNAELVDEMGQLGFGFVEIGTVTPQPQPGNDKPRLFRLKQDAAIINRMGFNNVGAEVAAARLRKRKTNIIVGGNIGKNKTTPNEKAIDDYSFCLRALHDCVDYFVVNVSSPNTPGLRALQDKDALAAILYRLQDINYSYPIQRPILLKIAPDLTNEQLDDIITIFNETKIAGLIATNTTVSRTGLSISTQETEAIGAGGLSGKPLTNRATEVIQYLTKQSNNSIPIIGVGGIMNEADALEKLQVGASLLQLYTGFIYEGPNLINRINRAILTQ